MELGTKAHWLLNPHRHGPAISLIATALFLANCNESAGCLERRSVAFLVAIFVEQRIFMNVYTLENSNFNIFLLDLFLSCFFLFCSSKFFYSKIQIKVLMFNIFLIIIEVIWNIYI